MKNKNTVKIKEGEDFISSAARATIIIYHQPPRSTIVPCGATARRSTRKKSGARTTTQRNRDVGLCNRSGGCRYNTPIAVNCSHGHITWLARGGRGDALPAHLNE